MSSDFLHLYRASLLSLMLMAGAQAQTKYPVVQKVQLHFSAVSHTSTISARVALYNANGGNSNYAVPFLVCDPVVTLYNPYPVPITINRLRVRISDPPVGFRFKKNNIYLRPDYANGTYLGLSRFQIQNESSTIARKHFTLILTDRNTAGKPGAQITLQPGESRRFSPWVESNWSWGAENPSDFVSKAFNDWDSSKDFTNVDGRTSNIFGAECLPGPDFRAGFQWDHLATSNRPAGTVYPFESTSFLLNGWVATRLTETFSVEARPQRVVSLASEPDFRITVLYGIYDTLSIDTRQDFPFSLSGLDTSALPSGKLSRTFVCQDILQSTTDTTIGGKHLFATLTAVAKPEALTSGRLEGNLSVSGNSCYQLSFAESFLFNEALSAGDARLGPKVNQPTVLHFAREASRLRLFMVAPVALGNWKILGGTSPDAIDTDITAQSTIVEAPALHSSSNQSKLITIDTTGFGPRYFVRVAGTSVLGD